MSTTTEVISKFQALATELAKQNQSQIEKKKVYRAKVDIQTFFFETLNEEIMFVGALLALGTYCTADRCDDEDRKGLKIMSPKMALFVYLKYTLQQ